MEEELNENELEERFYSMLHYVDETQVNVNTGQDALSILENAPRGTMRRYWRTSDSQKENNPYQKINTPKETVNKRPVLKSSLYDTTKPKEEKRAPSEPLPIHLSIFQTPVPQNLKNTIEIIETEDNCNIVELESSDDDEVIEVLLPPKPCITIESSDDDEHVSQNKSPVKKAKHAQDKSHNVEREVSASPVPSVVSSISDEFIRSDCIALNISSKHPDNHSFDFSLHGADLLCQSTPAKKKKKKKSKEVAPTPVVASTPDKSGSNLDECFATPKSKAKNKRQKMKSYTVSAKSIPNADVYDSDSNQSFIDMNKNQNSYSVTDNSFPSIDVYESDSNPSETVKDHDKTKQSDPSTIDVNSSDNSAEKPVETPRSSKKSNSVGQMNETSITIVDLTSVSVPNTTSHSDTDIQENIVIGNVSGFNESEDYDEEEKISAPNEVTKFGSTKVPAILYENLDFDNLKGKDQVCRSRRYSLTTLRADMEKFYNESWGGEDFNHREIQKNMSRDKSLWAIDPKDRMPAISKRKPICNYCNRPGHYDDSCRLKPAVCYMCGNEGHMEPRCPSKICVNCGSPNHVFSTMCRNCCTWPRITCAECGQHGHPASHCPDIWRRYHNTIELTTELEQNRFTKKHYQMFCSGCARRGHLVHTCRISLPFSGLPINSPYVRFYNPMYSPASQPQNDSQYYKKFQQDSTVSSATPIRNDRNKRQSKSPTVHESHVNKKKYVMAETETQTSPQDSQRKISQSKEQDDYNKNTAKVDVCNVNASESVTIEKAPDFIPIVSANRDNKGQIIQDNEVSDTSDAVTSARIYITNEIIDKLKTKDGEEWLKETTKKHFVTIQNAEITSFLSIKGKLGDQEAFQAALRDWSKSKPNGQAKSDNEADMAQELDHDQSLSSTNIPKNRNNVLRKLSKALNSLKEDLGEPKAIYKELMYLQNRHQQMLKQKVINPKQLSNNRDNMNETLKKLNIILLGQAGLAEGSKHVVELQSIRDKLINLRQKKISLCLREEIGLHYHYIFTAVPRDDYSELVKSYYSKTSSPKMKKKKVLVVSPKKKDFNTIPPQLKNESFKAKNNAIIKNKIAQVKKFAVEKTMHKLVFYHRRLNQARPIDAVLKKTRIELVRKLHSLISILGSNPNMNSKTCKKMKKIQERAKTFLGNV